MGYWEKKFIAIRNEWKKPIQHFPLAQTLVHCGFFFQKQYIREDIKDVERRYQDVTKGIITGFKGKKLFKFLTNSQFLHMRFISKLELYILI